MQFDPLSISAEESTAKSREAYQWMLDDPRGRRVLRQLLKFAGLDEPGSVADLGRMACDVGRRSVGVYLRERCEFLHPQGWLRFEAEHLQERQLAAREVEATEKAQPGPLEGLGGKR